MEIHCSCCFVWCWACGEEAHKPASCKTVHQWNVKNSAESENISWIRAHTKNCPKCSGLRPAPTVGKVVRWREMSLTPVGKIHYDILIMRSRGASWWVMPQEMALLITIHIL